MKLKAKRLLALLLILCVIIVCAVVYINSIRCYELDDFDSIIIGKHTVIDVWLVAPNNWLYITSYGGYFEYPMKDGRKIVIDFYGPDKVVENIRIIG